MEVITTQTLGLVARGLLLVVMDCQIQAVAEAVLADNLVLGMALLEMAELA